MDLSVRAGLAGWKFIYCGSIKVGPTFFTYMLVQNGQFTLGNFSFFPLATKLCSLSMRSKINALPYYGIYQFSQLILVVFTSLEELAKYQLGLIMNIMIAVQNTSDTYGVSNIVIHLTICAAFCR